jgi:hypothetical protein
VKLDWLTVDGDSISWDNGMLDASPDFFKNVEFLVDAKVRVRSPRFYFAEEVAGMETMMEALLTVEFLLSVLNIGLLEAPMPFGESDVFVTDNHDVFNKVREFEKAMSRSEAGKYAAEQRWKNHAKKETTRQETLLTPTDDAEVARTTGRPLSWALSATRDPKLTEILDRLVGDFSMSPPRYHEYDRIIRDPATKELLQYLESKGIVGKSDFDAGKTNAGIMAVGLLQNGLELRHSWAFAEPPKGFAPYAKARMIVEEGSPVINVTAYALNQIISSGRYKTQFETQESNGALNPYIRAAFESGTMGLHPNMDATKRPVYGTMQTFESIVNTHPMSQYGTISLQLNENVRERSTVSYNDSLGMARDTAPAESTGKELDRMFNTGSSGAHFDYVEAQIHGGVSFSDVKAIWVNEKYAPGDFENVTAILDKYGLSHIPVMRVGVDDFYKAMSRSEAGKYAAEQRWKNHAKQETLLTPTDDLEIARTTGRPLKWALPATRDPELTKILDRLSGSGNRIIYGYGQFDLLAEHPQTKELLDYLDKKGITGMSKYEPGVTNAQIMALGLILNATMAKYVRNLEPSNNHGSPVDFHERAREMVQNGSLCINITPDALGKMVSVGRYKTQFESYKSGGYFSPSTRASLESGGLGLHPDTDATKRPVYGTITSPDWFGSGYNPGQYGSVILQLKKSMRDHSTVSFNDSLGMPADLPPANSTGKDLDRMFENRSKFQPLDYVEAQIHGGVSMGDVKAVWVNENSHPDDFDLVRQALDANGYTDVPVYRIFEDEFEKAKFSSRSEAGKYAAHIRWMNQRGLTPMTADQWTASQSADATPVVTAPTAPSRFTATGMDWDAQPPALASMKDAITWLQDKWGGKTPGNQNRFRVKLNAMGSNPKTDHLAQAYAIAMDNLFKFAPIVAETIEEVVWDENQIRNSWGQASRDGHSMNFIASTFVQTLIQPDGTVIPSEQYALFAKEQAFSTGFKSSRSLSSTFYHEFGHHIGFAAGNKALYGDVKEVRPSLYADSDDRKKYNRELAKLVSPILKEHYGDERRARIELDDRAQYKIRGKIEKDISKYALTNYDELVAESAAQYFASKFEPDQPPANPLAIKIIETLMNYIEGENE